MSLFTRTGFEHSISRLPATTFHEQWDSLVAKVGGKVFCLFSPIDEQSGTIAFKCSEMTFEILSSIDGAGQAPYFAKRQWIAIVPDAGIAEDNLKAYLAEAHRTIASKLTKTVQAELGLSPVTGKSG